MRQSSPRAPLPPPLITRATPADSIVGDHAALPFIPGIQVSDRNGVRAYDAGLKFSAYDADDELLFVLV